MVHVHSNTFRATNQVAITERRELCRDACADLEYEAAKVHGEIEALRVELDHVKVLIDHVAD